MECVVTLLRRYPVANLLQNKDGLFVASFSHAYNAKVIANVVELSACITPSRCIVFSPLLSLVLLMLANARM